MKKLIAVSLVLILIISICAPAFAAYPKAAFTNASKKQWVRYGDKIYWTLKLNSDSAGHGLLFYNSRRLDQYLLAENVAS